MNGLSVSSELPPIAVGSELLNRTAKAMPIDPEPSRNSPCQCGSGRRYKHCHGAFPLPWSEALEAGLQSGKEHFEAIQARRQSQQGQGKPIISTKLGNVQIVGVGKQLRSGPWKTFEDFLDNNLKRSFGKSWAEIELKKQPADRHPLFAWIDELAKQMALAPAARDGIKAIRAVGAHAAYFGLAYNLYLLEHNADLKQLLLKRLRLKSEFHGAYYETCVAAAFILAGFNISLEDESNGGSTHCEFYATAPGSERRFWVEAKARAPGKGHIDVGNQLYKALKKETDAERIVLIDLNVLDSTLGEEVPEQMDRLLRSRQDKMTVGEEPAPAAFVFVTNFSAHLSIDSPTPRRMIIPFGFKQPDFGIGVGFPTVELAFKAKRRQLPLYQLMEHYKGYSIPSTFDGEVPQFAFGLAERRWIVGKEYQLDGIDQTGVLEAGFVDSSTSEATLIFRVGDTQQLYQEPLSAIELDAYKAHPQTFFGTRDTNAGREPLETQLDWFEFAYATYKETPKEQLLEFMRVAPDLEDLRELNQDELVIRYCGDFARAAFARSD